VLSPQILAQDPSSADVFLEEAVNASRFVHQNSIKILDADKRGNYTYIVMEYVEGKSLDEIIKEHGRLSVRASIEVALQLCKVLEVARTVGLIHQDIKPGNIMISNQGEVKLADFGLARLINEPSKYQSISGKIYGTPYYMSPEAFVEPEKIDYRSDMYSLGCSLYHSLTGILPFETTSIIKIITMHVTQNPLPPAAINYEINKELSAVVMKLLEKNQNDRYQSYMSLYKDLEFIHNSYISYSDRNIAS
jgi:serine/threonine-protein kinase